MAYHFPQIGNLYIPPLRGIITKPFHLAATASKTALEKNRWTRLALAAHETINTPYDASLAAIPFNFPELPHHYKVEETFLGKIKARHITSDVIGSTATIVFTLGHGTDVSHYIDAIDHFNQNGFNVRVLELTRPENNQFFANGTRIDDGYDELVSNGALDPESPLLKNIPSFHSVYLINHSASGQSFERVIEADRNKAAFTNHTYDRVYEISTMWDTANSSKRYAPKFSKLYNWYSSHPNVSPQVAGTTPVDIEWLMSNVTIDPEFFNDVSTNATHGQANIFKNSGILQFEKVEQKLNEGTLSAEFLAVRRTHIIGRKDALACAPTQIDYAELTKQHHSRKHVLDKVEHNGLREARKLVIAITRDMLNQEPLRCLTQAATSASPATRALQAV